MAEHFSPLLRENIAFRPELRLAVDLAYAAGKEAMRFFKTDIRTEQKSDNTPVTEADFVSEKIIIEGLRTQFPYPIISEETLHDQAEANEDYFWVVDPLDGTKSFILGEPTFAILIGLVYRGAPISGAAYFPAKETMYFAEEGKGAFVSKNGGEPVKISVSQNAEPKECSALLDKFLIDKPEITDFGFKEVKRIRGFAAKALAVAEGEADIYINTDQGGSEWDTCAPEIIVKEAGGKITDTHGNPLLYNQANHFRLSGEIVSNGTSIHQKVAEELIPKVERYKTRNS